MPRVEFEPTTPMFERAKTVHALDRAATVKGRAAPYTSPETSLLVRHSLVGYQTEGKSCVSNRISGVAIWWLCV
jgi:hypothetical protein